MRLQIVCGLEMDMALPHQCDSDRTMQICFMFRVVCECCSQHVLLNKRQTTEAPLLQCMQV